MAKKPNNEMKWPAIVTAISIAAIVYHQVYWTTPEARERIKEVGDQVFVTKRMVDNEAKR